MLDAVLNKIGLYPALLFWVGKNPTFGQPIQVSRPTRAEYEELQGYEPSKIQMDYENWADRYVEYETQSATALSKCPLLMQKVAVTSPTDPIIAEIESRPDFVRWHA